MCGGRQTKIRNFAMLKKTLLENNLMNKLAQIYNVDESGMPLDHCPPKVISEKGQKKVCSRTSGNKSQITFIACVGASGHALPPFVIFDTKGLNHEWTKGDYMESPGKCCRTESPAECTTE